MTILGVDVSENQNVALPWGEWPDVQVVVARASIGFRTDSHFSRYVQEAHAAGLMVGAYHVILGHQYYDPVRQAVDFLENMPAAVSFLVLDDEAPGVTTADVLAWVRHVTVRIAALPLLLYGNWNLAAHVAAAPELRRFGVWWAGYPTAPLPTTDPPWPTPRNVPAGLRVIGWQYAGDNGRLPPYQGAIDLTTWFEMPDATRPSLPEPVPPIAEAVALIDRTRTSLEGLLK